jgi:Flp pilus assembly protein TadG
MKNRSKKQRGASAVEFAIFLPILVLLLFGIIEFGLVLYNKAMITNASREGARVGIVSQNPRVSSAKIQETVEQYCKDYLISFGSTDKVEVISKWSSAETPPENINAWNDITSGSSIAFGYYLNVMVSYNYSFLLLPNLVDLTNFLTLSANTIMKYE